MGSGQYPCTYGCNNGACLITPTCAPQTLCLNNITKLTTNANCTNTTTTCTYGCTSGTCNSAPQPIIQTSCTDSDGGITPYTFGKITVTYNNGQTQTFSDLCDYNNIALNEQVCYNNTASGTTIIQCTYGCTSGTCKTAPTCTPQTSCLNNITKLTTNANCTNTTTTCTRGCYNNTCI